MTMSTRFAVLGVACLSFALSGCGLDQHPAYSDKVKYGVRTDPIFTGTGKELGDDRYEIDPAGTLPILSLKDIEKPKHPYAAKKADAIKFLRDPATLSSSDHQQLESVLELLFGTPAKPIVNAKDGKIDAKVVSDLQISDETLSKGSRLYRVHCLHCHGVSGDGRGPTAKWINPHPRDFRRGMFKFVSVDVTEGSQDVAPLRADLMRTLRQGIEGTAMPTFGLLKDEELEQIISYVIHLTMRGQVEYTLFKEDFSLDANGNLEWKQKETITENAKGWLEFYGGRKFWQNSQNPGRGIQPAPYRETDLAASMARGQQIFNAKPSPEFIKLHAVREVKWANALKKKKADTKEDDAELTIEEIRKNFVVTEAELKELDKAAADPEMVKKAETFIKAANCVSCHNNYGRQAFYKFDSWGTLSKPNNFTLGVFRGGRRPVDLYYRIHAGINGAGMTPFGKTYLGKEDYIWDLVNFVSNLQYPAMRKQLPISID